MTFPYKYSCVHICIFTYPLTLLTQISWRLNISVLAFVC